MIHWLNLLWIIPLSAGIGYVVCAWRDFQKQDFEEFDLLGLEEEDDDE